MIIRKNCINLFLSACILFLVFFISSDIVFSNGVDELVSNGEMNVIYKPQKIIRYDGIKGQIVSSKINLEFFQGLQPRFDFNISSSYSKPKNGFFSLGEERVFKISYNNRFISVKALLIAEGQHCYIWILDDDDYHLKTGTTHSDEYCTLKGENSFTADMAAGVSNKFDDIYVAMTNEQTGFAKHAHVNNPDSTLGPDGRYGDFGTDENGQNTGDGKISILLYDIDADGTSDGGHYAGFFSTGDFINPSYYEGSNYLDMFHMDIGIKQGYYALRHTSLNKYFFSTLAHEFQHMLNYMYAGYKVSVDDQHSFTWLNELLSAYANLYYTSPGEVVIPTDTILYAASNEYSPGTGFGDFLNFNQSFKNYAIANLCAMFFHDLDSNFQSKVYNTFKNIPSEEFFRSSSVQVAGRCFSYLFPPGEGGTYIDSMRKAYENFMVRFFADGGILNGSVTLEKFNDIFSDGSSLWDKRKEKISEIVFDGSTINLLGYDGEKTGRATHDKIYKVEGNTENKPYVNIYIPYEEGRDALYYLALNNDKTTELYTVTPGVTRSVKTNGENVYLCAASFLSDISLNVSVTWSDTAVYNTASEGGRTVVEVDNENFASVVNSFNSQNITLRFNLERGKSLDKGNLSLILGKDIDLVIYNNNFEFTVKGRDIISLGSENVCNIKIETYDNDQSSLNISKDDILSQFKFSIDNIELSKIFLYSKIKKGENDFRLYLYEKEQSGGYKYSSAFLENGNDIRHEIKNGGTYLCSSKIIGGIAFCDIPYNLFLNSVDANLKNSYIVKYISDDGEETIKFSYFDGEKVVFMPNLTGDYRMVLNSKYFSDVHNHWAIGYIQMLSSRGVFEGVEEQIFAPDEKVTRAMFVTALARLDGVDLSSFKSANFKDVHDDSWYFSSVAWASVNNIVLGLDDGTFAPSSNITREQAVVILSKYLNYKDFNLQENNTNLVFVDEAEISSWALSDVYKFNRLNIISGRGENLFDPKENASRAEVSVIFSNLIKSVLQY